MFLSTVDYTTSPRQINICEADKDIYVNDGYILTPNYPSSYPDSLYCKARIRRKELKNDRIEIYLIKLSTEKTSIVTANPTDYLEINNENPLFGNLEYEIVFNETKDVNLLFKADNLFNKGGILLYFKSNAFVNWFIINPINILFDF